MSEDTVETIVVNLIHAALARASQAEAKCEELRAEVERRTLRWTSARPTMPGMYLRWGGGKLNPPFICYVSESLRFTDYGMASYWSGPLVIEPAETEADQGGR